MDFSIQVLMIAKPEFATLGSGDKKIVNNPTDYGRNEQNYEDAQGLRLQNL